MIDAYNLSDATPVALFGMFALWAATSKRHWFVRTAVVGAAILAALSIPAFEAVVILTIETLVVAAGIAIWRRRRRARTHAVDAAPVRRFQVQLSMETLMLVVVIVAVVVAVIARAPVIEIHQWYQLLLSGMMSGFICLVCVWIVCGRAPWRIRLLFFPILVFALGFSYHVLQWIGSIVRYWYVEPGDPIAEYIRHALGDWAGLRYWIINTALGMLVLCAWLWLVRRADWFNPFNEQAVDAPETVSERRSAYIARYCAWILFGIVAIFPIALFYRLLTPTPLPTLERRGPNGFDDFVGAGKMIGPRAARKMRLWDQLSHEALRAELGKHEAAFERLNEGLRKPSWNPHVYKPWPDEDIRALHQLTDALSARGELARRDDEIEKVLEGNLTLLRLAQVESKGEGVHYYYGVLSRYESDCYAGIWRCAMELPERRFLQLVKELCALEASREPWQAHLDRQRVIEQNAGWQRHVQSILAQWSGKDPYASHAVEERRRVAMLRMLITKLALRAYEFDHGRLPDSLSQLVPQYLPDVPEDPFIDGPIRYRRAGKTYRLDSTGPDGDYDNGQPLVNVDGIEVGDLSDTALFPFPKPEPASSLME